MFAGWLENSSEIFLKGAVFLAHSLELDDDVYGPMLNDQHQFVSAFVNSQSSWWFQPI